MEYTFGMELEMILSPKPSTKANLLPPLGWKEENETMLGKPRRENETAVRDFIAGCFCNASIEAFANHNPGESRIYEKWSVEGDGSIAKLGPGFYELEIVSPVLFLMDFAWGYSQEIIMELWGLILLHFDVITDKTCGTHVHIRPTNGFSLPLLKLLSKALIMMEPHIEGLLPQERRSSDYAICRTMVDDGSLLATLSREAHGNQDFRKANRWIESHDKERLCETMSPTRHSAWNFANVLKSCGTVEFRSPPQVDSASETIHWIVVALSLVHIANTSSLPELGMYDKETFKLALLASARDLSLEVCLVWKG